MSVVRRIWDLLRFAVIVTTILVVVAVVGAWSFLSGPHGSTTSRAELEAVVLDVLADAPPDQVGDVRHRQGACTGDGYLFEGPEASAAWTVPIADERSSRDAVRDRILAAGYERSTAIWNQPTTGPASVQSFARIEDGQPAVVQLRSDTVGDEVTLTVVAIGEQRC